MKPLSPLDERLARSGTPRELDPARGVHSVLAGALEAVDTHGVRLAISLGGSPFVGLDGREPVSPRARKEAELALVGGGGPRPVREHREAWLAAAISRPVPVLIAARGTARAARLAIDRLSTALAETALPRRLRDDPLLRVQATSPSLTPVLDDLRRIAPAPLPLLLLGETGTGKEVLARAVHDASRRPGAFIAENCAALPENLLEAELFGALRGSFTGAHRDRRGRIAEADGGTLFLDEIGDLPPALQAKLLRVLQEREVRPLGAPRALPVDVRVVAATHRAEFGPESSAGFRADLYFRLAGFVCTIAPLRERRADLPYLCAALLTKLAGDGIGPGRYLSPSAVRALERIRSFPGNVRELDNILRRAAALSDGPLIATLDRDGCPGVPPPAGNLEAAMLRDALREAGGVKAEAARRLGWSRQKLNRRLKALGLFRTARREV